MSIWRGNRGRKSFKKSDISKPTQFEHRIHANLDPRTGDICGLPIQWQAFLSSDFICKSRPHPMVDNAHFSTTNYQRRTSVDEIDRESGPPAKCDNIPDLLSYSTKMSTSAVSSTITQTNGNHHVGKFAPSYSSQNVVVPAFTSNVSPMLTNGAKLSDEQFRDALLSIVNCGDPRADLSKFIQIEKGSTSTVFGSYLLSKRRKVAVKCMNVWRQQRRELLFNEILVLRDLPRHPNLVEVFSSHLVGDELWVIMEFMDGGSLTNLITHKRLEEALIATVCRQCLEGLAFLHSNRIIHRDIKSDSILISSDGTAKISDFGFCGRLTAEFPRRRSLLGTPYWFSAQVAAKEPYGTDADIWSFGITVIEMVFGEPPYFEDPPQTAMRKIIELPAATLPPAANASPELESFVNRMLVKEVATRSTAAQLLKHPFLYKAKHPSSILPIVHEVQQKLSQNPQQ